MNAMQEHFTSIVNTDTRWNSLCSLLDNNEYWKLFATQLNIAIDSITEERVHTTNENNQSASPSTELLNRFKKDDKATIAKLLEILSSINNKDAISLIQSWIDEDTPLKSLFRVLHKPNRKLEPGEEEYNEFLTYFWKSWFRDGLPSLLKAAELGYPPAYVRLGTVQEYVMHQEARKQKYFALAVSKKEWFIEQAQTGECMAQYHLGLYYEKMEQNYPAAIEWLQKSADQNNPFAQKYIAWCYETGTGVAQDWPKAVEWYQKSADQRQPSAECDVGWCYEFGKGVEKNPEKAVYWYQRASNQELPRALCNLGYCYEYGFGVEQNEKKAFELYMKAADKGLPRGEYSVGLCYEYATGVDKDLSKALEWLHKAANHQHAKAYLSLAQSYYYGTGTDKNLEQAVYWWQKGADAGLAEAQYALACCLEDGLGTKMDKQKAALWFKKAAENGHADAKPNWIYVRNG